MEREEKIERLAERMKVTLREAGEALDACGGDLLDAALFLERSRPAGERVVHTHSTAAAMATVPETAGGREEGKAAAPVGDRVTEIIMAILTGLVNHPILNGLRLESKGKTVLTVPGLMLLILLVARYWVVLGLTAIGLFAGWHFAWIGPQWDNVYLNGAWTALEGKVAALVASVKGGHRHG